MGKRSAAFVDRDDTIIADDKYCSDPEKVKVLDGAGEGLRLLAAKGYCIVIVTNQSGIGRHYFNEDQLKAVHDRMRQQLRRKGADFDALYYCPHRPKDNCSCRKPQPGLILRAASELNLELQSSYTIGNSEQDLEAGRRAGTRTVLIRNDGAGVSVTENDYSHADITAKNLEEAVRTILKQN